jgi:hypothetical protein
MVTERIVNRTEILSQLYRWSNGDLSSEQIQNWAMEIYKNEAIDYDDWEELLIPEKPLWKKLLDIAKSVGLLMGTAYDGVVVEPKPGDNLWKDVDKRIISVSYEVITALSIIGVLQLTREDIPMLVDYLNTPPGQISGGKESFNDIFGKINFEERVKELRKDPFYSRYLKKSQIKYK